MKPDPDALFVGRQKELARLRSELEAGRNPVLTGRFGVGRTALLRRLARENEGRWRFVFVDGSQPPGRMCEELFLALFPHQASALQRAKHPQSFMRQAIERCSPKDRRPHVVVLDDIAKLTHPRVEFLRWLRGLDRFRIIAVTEIFLLEEALRRLRALLVPSPLMVVERLKLSACVEFFQAWSHREALAWDSGVIQGLARASNGYPLTLWELARSPALTGAEAGADGEASRAGARFSWIGSGRRP